MDNFIFNVLFFFGGGVLLRKKVLKGIGICKRVRSSLYLHSNSLQNFYLIFVIELTYSIFCMDCFYVDKKCLVIISFILSKELIQLVSIFLKCKVKTFSNLIVFTFQIFFVDNQLTFTCSKLTI